MSRDTMTLSYLEKPASKTPKIKFLRVLTEYRRVRSILREAETTPDYGEAEIINWGYSKPLSKRLRVILRWCDENDKTHRDDDRPAEVHYDGNRFWLRHGVIHRENAPAHIDVWGNGRWTWNGYPASDALNALLNLAYDDGELTEETAARLFALAEEYVEMENADAYGAFSNYPRGYDHNRYKAGSHLIDGLPTVSGWLSLVVARHRSPNLSDEYRTMLALTVLASPIGDTP